MTVEPILIECEGVGAVNQPPICPMCGTPVDERLRRVPPHKRHDILTMIDRGDFG